MLSQDGNHLLACAVSRLNPEIFLHPVWVRFGKKKVLASLEIIDELLSAAKAFQESDPSSACQILLICAVCQNYTGQLTNSLRTIQQSLTLAEHNNLTKEIIWTKWGACAIYFQQGNYELAACHLEDLQAILGQQKEWVLSDYVEVIKQSLFDPGTGRLEKHSRSPRDPPFGDLLTNTFDWLQHWGYLPQAFESASELISRHPIQQTATQPFFVQRWRGGWNKFTLALRNRFGLHSVENDSYPAERRFSFRQSHLDSTRLRPSKREADAQIPDKDSDPPGISLLSKVKEISPSITQSPKLKHVSADEQSPGEKTTSIPVIVQMLGAFSLTIQDSLLKIPVSRGLSLLKYLLLHHKQDTPREVLMDIFWPDADPEAARNNLNVAMHNLRQALHSVTDVVVIRFKDGAYGLATDLEIWLDVKDFEDCIREGQRMEAQNQLTAAMTEYEIAVNLYRGDFLADNPYEGWTVLDRERLRVAYLDTLDHLSQIQISQEQYAACIRLCQLILNRDLCREDAHCRLMQCYSRLGQGPLALRQYQICVEALRIELEVDPAPETTQLYSRIRHHEQV
jgi:DNA-binding SARP family transcriptional activator